MTLVGLSSSTESLPIHPTTKTTRPCPAYCSLSSYYTEDGTHYAYSLRTTDVEREDLVQAFAKAAGITVNIRFTGDWTTSDDDGIEYSLNTRRNYVSINYQGDDAAAMERAKEKAAALRTRLHLTSDTPKTPDAPR